MSLHSLAAAIVTTVALLCITQASALPANPARQLPYPAPAIEGITHWINSAPLTPDNLAGKVVLVDFWAYSCVNCVRTLPHLRRWHEAYHDKGLVIVGVHSPEFDFEKDPGNVKHAVQKWKIPYAVAMDNDMVTWNNFSNQYWPAHYLINRGGQVVYTHFGEGNYAETEASIRRTLGMDAATAHSEEKQSSYAVQTPETYLGYFRMEHFASPEPVGAEKAAPYTYPQVLPLHHWALQGTWAVGSQSARAESRGASLRLHFRSHNVFLVLGTRGGRPVEATITLNGKPPGNFSGKDAAKGRLTVNKPILYELIAQPEMAEGIVEIKALDAGLEAYAFTFGK